MQTDKITQEFEILWKTVSLLQQDIGYSYMEALSETLQNMVDNRTVQQVDGKPSAEICEQIEKLYQTVSGELSGEDWRKVMQYLFLKASKKDNLQTNHAMTPDTIALLVAFMLNELLAEQDNYLIGDFSVGSGNLLAAVYHFLNVQKKHISLIGVDNDELLLHLASQSIILQKLPLTLLFQDGLRPIYTNLLDVAISELPVGYYPDDTHAQQFDTATTKGHSYAHHLLIEQHIRYLKDGAFGLFIVPTNLFESEQANLLLQYLNTTTHIQAMLNLPIKLFQQAKQRKSILIVQKKSEYTKQAKQVLLGDIPDIKAIDKFTHFTKVFKQWASELKSNQI